VLVDDAGDKLAEGHPTGALPELFERRRNYQVTISDARMISHEWL
jgi:hypothetical protein